MEKKIDNLDIDTGTDHEEVQESEGIEKTEEIRERAESESLYIVIFKETATDKDGNGIV